MDWLTSNWQSITAGIVVAVTAAVFTLRILRRRNLNPPCGKDCGCG